MQTFIPDGPYLQLGFQHLDYRRLGKQRVEAWQILNILRGVDNEGNPKVHGGWRNHPATKMWEGYPHGLAIYGALCCQEWIARGYNDTMLPRFIGVADDYAEDCPWAEMSHVIWPRWLWDYSVAETHRSNLIRKAPDLYGKFWPDTPEGLEYIWPTNPWLGTLDRCIPVPRLLTPVNGDDMMRISNEGNALMIRKGAMMARKAKVEVDELEELEELDEVTESDDEVADSSGMLTAKAAASMLGTDGRTLRKFLRKKYGVLGQGKRWEVDPSDIDELKADFESFSRGTRTKAEGDDAPAKPKNRVTKPKAKAPKDPIYDDMDEDDDDIMETLDDLEGPDDDDIEELEDIDFDD